MSRDLWIPRAVGIPQEYQDSRMCSLDIYGQHGVEDVYLILLSCIPSSGHVSLDIYVDLEEYRDTGM